MKSQSVIPKCNEELAKWCEALQEPSVAAEEVPAGWMTTAEIAQASGKDRSTVSGQISLLIRKGKAQMKRFRVMTGRGIYPVPHYKLQ